MSGNLGSLSVDMLLNTVQWTAGLSKVEQQAKAFEKSLDRSFNKITDSVNSSIKSFAGLATAALGIREIVTATAEAEASTARMEFAVGKLAATSELTTEKLNALADSISATTQFDDESVKDAAANILRFGDFSEEVFTRLIKVSADYAAQMKTDLPGAADTLAKAMASPAQGMERLQRQIGYINESTKSYIKSLDESGQTIAAQNELLKLLEASYGGAAEKMNGTLAGALANSKKGFSDLAEAIGNISVINDTLKSFFDFLVKSLRDLTEIINKGEVQNFFLFLLGFRKELSKPVGEQGFIGKDTGKKTAAEMKQAEDAAKKWATEYEAQQQRALKVLDENVKKRVKKYEDENKAIFEIERKANSAEERNTQAEMAYRARWAQVKENMAERETQTVLKELNLQAEAQKAHFDWLEAQTKEQADLLEKQWGGFYKGIESSMRDAFDSMFDKNVDGWEGMLNTMKNAFKRILMDYVWQALAKPLVMNLMTQMPGGLGQFATSQIAGMGGGGGGFDITSILGLGGGGGLASSIGSMIGGEFGAGMMGMQLAGPTSLLGGAGSMLATAMPYLGLALGAISLISGLKKPSEPVAALAFGRTAAGYEDQAMMDTAFGSFGFADERTQYFGGEVGMQTTAVIGNLLNAVASTISDESVIQAISTRLASHDFAGMKGKDLLQSDLPDMLKEVFGVVFEDLSPAWLEKITSFEGDAEAFVEMIQGFVTLASISADVDWEAMVEAASPKTAMEKYQLLSGSFQELVANADDSTESINALASGVSTFEQATIAMVLAIDAAAEAIHTAFMDTSERITRDLLNPEQLYERIQSQTDALYEQLATETDPAAIQQLAEQINSNINEAWGMLDEDQQSALGEAYLERIAALDALVAEKMQALRDVVIEDADTVIESVADRLDVLFGRAADTADINQQAANTNLQAAQTPVRVVVDVPANAVNGG